MFNHYKKPQNFDKMAPMREQKLLLISILISIFFHLFWVNLLDSPLLSKLLPPTNISTPTNRPIEVTPLDLEEYRKKMRTVGVKDGKKDSYSEEVPFGLPDLKALGKMGTPPSPEKGKIAEIKRVQNSKTSKRPPQTEGSIKFSPSEMRELNPSLLRDLSLGSTGINGIKGANFNLTFETPEGVSEDELNTTEKIYYSFQRRTFKSYVSSFLSAYNEVATSRPSITRSAPRKQTLTGKVTYDKDGNIVAIKILKWSEDDDIQYLFEQTLEKIHSLPNPPKTLVEKNGEFSIYYQLNFNG